MTPLIPIHTRPIGGKTQQTVNARELWRFVESQQQFADWIKNRIAKWGFVEGEDFNLHKFMEVRFEGAREVERQITDYFLTINMAKELAMVEANEKGREVRKYFIDCERLAKMAHDARVNGAHGYVEMQGHRNTRRLAHPSAPDRMVNSLINRRAYELTHQLMPEIRRFLREKLAYEQRLSLENGAVDVYSSEWIADALFDCTSEQAITEVYANI